MRISDWSSDVCSSDLVGDQSVVLGFQPRRGLARFADIGGGLDLELVRRQADYADAGEGLRRPFSEVVANAGDQIPPPRDRTAVQDFEIGRLGRAVDPLAFAAQPDRSEEHPSELQPLMRISYAVF